MVDDENCLDTYLIYNPFYPILQPRPTCRSTYRDLHAAPTREYKKEALREQSVSQNSVTTKCHSTATSQNVQRIFADPLPVQ